MTTAFISRKLRDDSALKSLSLEWHDESLISIEALPFRDIPKADIYFFYSQNGVHHFFQNPLSKAYMSKPIACMGKSTAASVVSYGIENIAFIGSGDTNGVAKAYKKYIEHNFYFTCFVQAENSLQTVSTVLDAQDYTTLNVYHSKEKAIRITDTFDIYIFTSPLNVTSFHTNNDYISKSSDIIAIGSSTKQRLQELGYKTIFTPKESDEKGLFELVQCMLH